MFVPNYVIYEGEYCWASWPGTVIASADRIERGLAPEPSHAGRQGQRTGYVSAGRLCALKAGVRYRPWREGDCVSEKADDYARH